MDSILYDAAIKGDIDVLSQNEDKIRVQMTPTNNTVLHLASQLGKTEAVKVILSIHPSLLTQQNSRDETALHLAARCGRVDVVRVLIDYAKAVDVEEMIESGVKGGKYMLRMTNCDNDTALHEAVRYNRLEVVRKLTEEDPKYSYSGNKAGETPLYLAAIRGFPELVSVILKNCESPAYGGPDGRTALHGAIISDSPGCTEELLEWKKYLITETDLYGQTPLHYASFFDSGSTVELVTDEYTAYLADKDKNTAIHLAARRGHVDIMKKLMSRYPGCIDMVNAKGQNILHIAQEHEQKKVIEYILEHCDISLIFQMGIDVNMTMADKRSAKRKRELAEYRKHVRKLVDTQMIVAALIATVTFAAGFTVPGGYSQNEGPNMGMAVLTRKAAFKAFIITDTIALVFSTSSILFNLIAAYYREDSKDDHVYILFALGSVLGLLALIAMMVAFVTGTYAVLAHSLALAIATCVIGCSAFIIYFLVLRNSLSPFFKYIFLYFSLIIL